MASSCDLIDVNDDIVEIETRTTSRDSAPVNADDQFPSAGLVPSAVSDSDSSLQTALDSTPYDSDFEGSDDDMFWETSCDLIIDDDVAIEGESIGMTAGSGRDSSSDVVCAASSIDVTEIPFEKALINGEVEDDVNEDEFFDFAEILSELPADKPAHKTIKSLFARWSSIMNRPKRCILPDGSDDEPAPSLKFDLPTETTLDDESASSLNLDLPVETTPDGGAAPSLKVGLPAATTPDMPICADGSVMSSREKPSDSSPTEAETSSATTESQVGAGRNDGDGLYKRFKQRLCSWWYGDKDKPKPCDSETPSSPNLSSARDGEFASVLKRKRDCALPGSTKRLKAHDPKIDMDSAGNKYSASDDNKLRVPEFLRRAWSSFRDPDSSWNKLLGGKDAQNQSSTDNNNIDREVNSSDNQGPSVTRSPPELAGALSADQENESPEASQIVAVVPDDGIDDGLLDSNPGHNGSSSHVPFYTGIGLVAFLTVFVIVYLFFRRQKRSSRRAQAQSDGTGRDSINLSSTSSSRADLQNFTYA